MKLARLLLLAIASAIPALPGCPAGAGCQFIDIICIPDSACPPPLGCPACNGRVAYYYQCDSGAQICTQGACCNNLAG